MGSSYAIFEKVKFLKVVDKRQEVTPQEGLLYFEGEALYRVHGRAAVQVYLDLFFSQKHRLRSRSLFGDWRLPTPAKFSWQPEVSIFEFQAFWYSRSAAFINVLYEVLKRRRWPRYVILWWLFLFIQRDVEVFHKETAEWSWVGRFIYTGEDAKSLRA